ncbi:hypothetical protein MTO96_042877 [Rhipicephalus appendiculatus]
MPAGATNGSWPPGTTRRPSDLLPRAVPESAGPPARDPLLRDDRPSSAGFSRRRGTTGAVQGNAAVTPLYPTTCRTLPHGLSGTTTASTPAPGLGLLQLARVVNLGSHDILLSGPGPATGPGRRRL